ncbi:hypothetical protein ACWXWU_13615 [Shewanella sp. A14]
MSEIDIGIAVKASKGLETKLAESFNAEGKGLHEKVTSVESELPHSLVKTLRYIASIRNKVVHEDEFQIDDVAKFKAVAEEALADLERIAQQNQQAKVKVDARAQTKAREKHQSAQQQAEQSHVNQQHSGSIFKLAFWFVIVAIVFSMCSRDEKPRYKAPNYNAPSETAKVATSATKVKQVEPEQQPSPKTQAAETRSKTNAAVNQLPAQAKNIGVVPVQTSTEAIQTAKDTGKQMVSSKSFSLNDKKNAYQQKMQQTQDAFFQALLALAKESQFSLGEINVQPNGSTNTLYIPVKYQVNTSVIKTFEQHLPLRVTRSDFVASITQFSVEDDPFKSDLYRWLVGSEVSLIIKAGSHTSRLTLAMGRKCFVSCSGKGTDQFHLLTKSSAGQKTLLYKQHNAIALSGISQKQLSGIGHISGHVEIRDLKGYKNQSIEVFNLAVNGRDLIDNASNNQDAFVKAKQTIDNDFSQLLQQTSISIGDVDVTQSGSNATVHVPVSWQFDKRVIEAILSPHLDINSRSALLNIKDIYNKDDKQKQPYSYALLQDLFTKTVTIEVSAGKYHGTLTVGSPMKCFVSCSKGTASNADSYQLQLTGNTDSNRLNYKQTNPIAINNIPVAELKSIKGIEARVLVE